MQMNRFASPWLAVILAWLMTHSLVAQTPATPPQTPPAAPAAAQAQPPATRGQDQPAGNERLRPVPNPPAKYIVGSPDVTGPGVKQMMVDLPLCTATASQAKIIPAINAVKAEMGVNGKLADFMKRLNEAGDCGVIVKLLEDVSPGIIDRTPADSSITIGPDDIEYITDRNDPALKEYGIPFDVPFTEWHSQRVSLKELWTLDDFRDARDVIKDHIKYMSVPNPSPTPGGRAQAARLAELRAKTNGKFDHLQQHAPALLDGCLDESWRWKMGLCSIKDGADIPIWPETWATQAEVGVFYNLSFARRAPALVAFDQETGESLAFGGPCGGNGIWVASKTHAIFKTEAIANYAVCKNITADKPADANGDIVLRPGESVTLTTEIEVTGPQAGTRQENFVWRQDGQQMAGVPVGNKQVRVMYDQLDRELVNISVESPRLNPNNPKATVQQICRTRIRKFVPPTPLSCPVCETITASVDNGRVYVQVNADDFEQANHVILFVGKDRATAVQIPDSQVRQEQARNTASFPLSLVPEGEMYVFARITCVDGTVSECPAKAPGSRINRPCPTCPTEPMTLRVGPDGVTLNASDFFRGVRLKPGSVRWIKNGGDPQVGSSLFVPKDEMRRNKEIQFDVVAETADGCVITCHGILKSPFSKTPFVVVALVAAAVCIAGAATGHGFCFVGGKEPTPPPAGTKTGVQQERDK